MLYLKECTLKCKWVKNSRALFSFKKSYLFYCISIEKDIWKFISYLTTCNLGYENEENVLVCLRIIIELHKQFRPAHSIEITHFLQFVKSIYNELPNHLSKIFEPRAPIKVIWDWKSIYYVQPNYLSNIYQLL